MVNASIEIKNRRQVSNLDLQGPADFTALDIRKTLERWRPAMRIDSGLSNFFYNSRFQRSETELEDTSAESNAASRPRAASNPSVSSTLLSSSLASALWSVEGGKRNSASQSAEEIARASSAEKVEAFYLEYAMPVDEVH